MLNFLFFIYLLLGVLLSVAFMVLLERKVLGYIQLRKGPNKVGLLGVIQSFSDAIKLFIKEQYFPMKSNKLIYCLSPIFSLFLVLMIWISFPKKEFMINWYLGALFFFCCTSLSVYSLIGSGWSSNSNYSLIGSIRGVAQTVSYEVSLILVFMIFMVYGSKFDFAKTLFFQSFLLNLFIFLPFFFVWFISSLAETNRTPFDFSEGESELVSGFNIEYSSGGFALIFLAEYASIIFMSFLISVLFISAKNYFVFYLISMLWIYSFVWIRSCYPRFRYDKLMNLSWKVFLPFTLFFFVYFLLFF